MLGVISYPATQKCPLRGRQPEAVLYVIHADREALYVGQSINPGSRLNYHQWLTEKYPEATTTIMSQRCALHALSLVCAEGPGPGVLALEKALILTHRPKWNFVHNRQTDDALGLPFDAQRLASLIAQQAA